MRRGQAQACVFLGADTLALASSVIARLWGTANTSFAFSSRSQAALSCPLSVAFSSESMREYAWPSAPPIGLLLILDAGRCCPFLVASQYFESGGHFSCDEDGLG